MTEQTYKNPMQMAMQHKQKEAAAAVEGAQQVKELGGGRYETADGVLLKLAETKSKRMQILMYPSLHASVKKLADAQNKSVNDLVNEALQDYVKQH